MATLTSNAEHFQCANSSENSTDARNKFIYFLKQYTNKSASAQANQEFDSYVSYYYQNLFDEFFSENYEGLIKYNRKSVGLYSKIINEIKKDPQNYFSFNMGRLIGSSQITNKYVDKLYTQLLAYYALNKITNSKDLLYILEMCYKNGRMYNQDLCTLIDSKPNNLTKKMKTLIDLDLVTRHQIGKKVYYTLTTVGKKTTEKMHPLKSIRSPYVSYMNFPRERCIGYIETKQTSKFEPLPTLIKSTKEPNIWRMNNYEKNN